MVFINQNNKLNKKPVKIGFMESKENGIELVNEPRRKQTCVVEKVGGNSWRKSQEGIKRKEM